MNEVPGARARVALSGLTMAEAFRDEGGKDVLFFMDNVFRFVQAGSEVSSLLGRVPSAVGYQPTLAEEMGLLQERITSTTSGSITSVQAIYVPADDLTDPAPATTFSHLDSTIVLSRALASLGIYPAIDPARIRLDRAHSEIVGEEHYRVANETRRVFSATKICRTSSQFSVSKNFRKTTRNSSIARAKSSASFRSHFQSPKHLPAHPGKYVSLADTVRGFGEILSGKYDAHNEQDFYMKGGAEPKRSMTSTITKKF
jgi:F-type H+-transporting ATPase subunit beta